MGRCFGRAERLVKDAGLNVSIQDGKGSSSRLQLLGAGKVDIAFVQQLINYGRRHRKGASGHINRRFRPFPATPALWCRTTT